MVVQRTLTPPVGVRSSHPQPVYRSSNMLRVFYRGVAQMVARLVRDQEAVGSNPVTPTIPFVHRQVWRCTFCFIPFISKHSRSQAQFHKDGVYSTFSSESVLELNPQASYKSTSTVFPFGFSK